MKKSINVPNAPSQSHVEYIVNTLSRILQYKLMMPYIQHIFWVLTNSMDNIFPFTFSLS